MAFMTWFSVYGSVKQAIQDVVGAEIQTLRGDIKAVNARIDGLEKRFEAGFEQIDRRFEQVDKRFDQLGRRMDQFDRRLDQLEMLFRSADQRWNTAIDIHERLAIVEAKLERLQ